MTHFPAVGLKYGTLILCRVLPGKCEKINSNEVSRETETSDIPPNFDSRQILFPDCPTSYSVCSVVKNSDQILPFCILHLDAEDPLSCPDVLIWTTTSSSPPSGPFPENLNSFGTTLTDQVKISTFVHIKLVFKPFLVVLDKLFCHRIDSFLWSPVVAAGTRFM